MGLKECDKCGEMVGEAKAFCPACGHAFVEEEQRQETSKFDSFEHTVQFGQTMYNMMLSDMGLNISKSPNPGEKRVEVLEPATPAEKQAEIPAAAPRPVERQVEVLQPVSTAPVQTAATSHETQTPSNVLKYVLIGLAVLVVFLVMVVAAVLVFVWMLGFG